MPEDLSADLIAASLDGRFGEALRYFDQIGSTNSAAMQWATKDAPEGAVVVADHQNAGRGRWGRSWFSTAGGLLQFSLVLRPRIPVGHHGILTAALGVATAEAIEDLTALPARVKWPNDVTINERKVAGMLVESTVTGPDIDVAVCGIGINVHVSEGDLPLDIRSSATSIEIEMARSGGSAPTRALLLACVLAAIEDVYPAVLDPARHPILLEAAAQRSTVLGRYVVVRFPDGRTLEGRALRFASDGGLEIDTAGRAQVVHVGEVERLRTE